MVLELFVKRRGFQGRRELFHGAGGWEALKQSPKIRNLDQTINDSKSNLWNFFLKILFWAYKFFIFIQTCQWISDLLAESLKSKKDNSFYNTVLLRKPHSFSEPRLAWHWG